MFIRLICFAPYIPRTEIPKNRASRHCGEMTVCRMQQVLSLAVLISINLRYQPYSFPALDGAAWLSLRWKQSRQTDRTRRGLYTFIGFVVLMALMIVVTYRYIDYNLKDRLSIEQMEIPEDIMKEKQKQVGRQMAAPISVPSITITGCKGNIHRF